MYLTPCPIDSCKGFLKKDARFSKLKNIPDLRSDETEGEKSENFEYEYFRNRATFKRNPVSYYILSDKDYGTPFK